MKRTFCYLWALAFCMMSKAEVVGDWSDYRAESFSSINTEAKTIAISSASELALLAYDVNIDTYRDYNITLNNDLDLGEHYWKPIGNTANSFIGSFDGNGHVIYNLNVRIDGSKTGYVAGLFGQIGSGGIVKDVTINGTLVRLQLQSTTASCYIGAICGINNGSIIGCANSAEVRGNYASSNVGGIAGENRGIIQNCYNLGEVYTSSNSNNFLGGIVGNNAGRIQNCFVRAIIDDGGNATDGPICGNNGGTATGCFYMNGKTTDPLTPYIRAFSNNESNSSAITSAVAAGDGQNILLQGRTIYSDEAWNTFCVPFSIPAGASGYSPIAGATVMELDPATSNYNSSTGVLTLNFTDATTIEAGKPYLVKWDDAIAQNLSNPVFLGVTVVEKSETECSVTTNDGIITFQGIFDPLSIPEEDKTKLYLGDANALYYPNAAMTIGTFRAYFQLNGITVGEPGSLGIKAFVLNFGDGEETGIRLPDSTGFSQEKRSDYWFTIDGRKLKGIPTQHGIYVNNGKKVIIK